MIKSRNDLAIHFNELGFKTGAEIGVLGGTYSEILCKANPTLKLYCVDSWGIGEGRLHDYHLRKYEVAKIKLALYNTILMRKLSMDAVKEFKDESLDFVYIDANHSFDFVINDINEWGKKVKNGGIISGHDYALGVKKAVDTYAETYGFNLQLTTKNKGGISWWFIKKYE